MLLSFAGHRILSDYHNYYFLEFNRHHLVDINVHFQVASDEEQFHHLPFFQWFPTIDNKTIQTGMWRLQKPTIICFILIHRLLTSAQEEEKKQSQSQVPAWCVSSKLDCHSIPSFLLQFTSENSLALSRRHYLASYLGPIVPLLYVLLNGHSSVALVNLPIQLSLVLRTSILNRGQH